MCTAAKWLTVAIRQAPNTLVQICNKEWLWPHTMVIRYYIKQGCMELFILLRLSAYCDNHKTLCATNWNILLPAIIHCNWFWHIFSEIIWFLKLCAETLLTAVLVSCSRCMWPIFFIYTILAFKYDIETLKLTFSLYYKWQQNSVKSLNSVIKFQSVRSIKYFSALKIS
jgi:hypothetical protein